MAMKKKLLEKLLTPAINRFFVACYDHYVQKCGDSIAYEDYQKEIYERLKKQ